MIEFPLIVLGVVLAVAVVLAILYRKVVSTNMVHIVQSNKRTTPMEPVSKVATSITAGQAGFRALA